MWGYPIHPYPIIHFFVWGFGFAWNLSIQLLGYPMTVESTVLYVCSSSRPTVAGAAT